jgi:hypothetical protein
VDEPSTKFGNFRIERSSTARRFKHEKGTYLHGFGGRVLRDNDACDTDYPAMKTDEEFWSEFRPGGGPPMDDMERNHDSISQMGMAKHRPDVLYNALRDMGCQLFDAARCFTGASGFGCANEIANTKRDAIQNKIWNAGAYATVFWYNGHRGVELIARSAEDERIARLALKPGYDVLSCVVSSTGQMNFDAVKTVRRELAAADGKQEQREPVKRPQNPRSYCVLTDSV